MIRQLILGLLRNGGALHGYALMKGYRDGTGRRLSTGNFYRALHKLETSGLVRQRQVAGDADPRRRPYEITEAGAAAFDAWLNGPCRDGIVGPDDDGYSLRAFFVLETGSPLARRVLREWREELRAGRTTLTRACERLLSKEREAGETRPSTRALWFGRRLKHLETDLAFVEQLEAALETAANGTKGAVWPPSPVPTPARTIRTAAADSGRLTT